MAPRKKPVKKGRPTQEQLDIRKACVREVAEALFLSRGFSGTSVAEIARRSRVSPRLVAAHFGDKEQIFARTIIENSAVASQLFIIPYGRSDLEQILFEIAQAACDLFYAPVSMRFSRMLVGEGERMAAMTSAITREASHYFFGTIETIFTDLIARGLIGSGDPVRLTKYFIDLTVGFAVLQSGMGYHDRIPDEAELRDKIRFFRLAVTMEAAMSDAENSKAPT